ncbi:MAG: glycosyltransferase family 4 protein [Planctomycetes bacterium]|nr:glycosyltransferase family 4 protein [Planctomycetota bacterium]
MTEHQTLRVALVLDRFDPKHGGLEHWAFQLARWLIQRGHEVHIVAAECSDDSTSLPLIMHPVGHAQSRVALAEALECCLRQLTVDVIHDLGSGWYFDVLQPQFGTKRADHRGNLRSLPWFKRPKYLWKKEHRLRLRDACALERLQYSQPHGQVIAVSRMTRADIKRDYPLADERMTVIHNGVNPGQFSPDDQDHVRGSLRRELHLDGKVVLLFAGHNFRLKGLETVLRAIHCASNPRLQLLVVGREPTEKWQKLAAGLGIGNQVRFCGFVPEIHSYYATADAFVQPTFYDPCSLVALEAAASGLPVVTSRFNGAAELFQHGTHGFIVQNPRDHRETARCLRALLDGAARQQMGAAARELALRNTTDQCFERIFQVYQSIVRNGLGLKRRFDCERTGVNLCHD